LFEFKVENNNFCEKMWKISLIVISFGLFGIISAQYDYIDEQENEILEQYVDGFSGSYPGKI
jgi:hypothetical protein